MRKFSKMTMLLFVAAAMFAFASCDKDDDASIKESQLVGKWYWQAARGTLEIQANHEARLNGIDYNWTLKGNKFNAIHDNYVSYENIDVEINLEAGSIKKKTGITPVINNTYPLKR